MDMMDQLATANINSDIQIGFLQAHTVPSLKSSPLSAILHTLVPSFREVLGVHHAKFAVFDDSVVLTGANLEEQYFLSRRDRYWIINNCRELADYLEDYALNLLSASEQIAWDGELFGVSQMAQKDGPIFRLSRRIAGESGPSQVHTVEDEENQLGTQAVGMSVADFRKKMKNMVGVFTYCNYMNMERSKGRLAAGMLGDRSERAGELENGEKSDENYLPVVTNFEDLERRKTILGGLNDASEASDVAGVLRDLDFDPFLDFDEDEVDDTESVFLAPMMQFNMIDVDQDYQFMLRLLEYCAEDGYKGENGLKSFDFISGYMNPTDDMIELIEGLEAEEMSFITAAPEVSRQNRQKSKKFDFRIFQNLSEKSSKFDLFVQTVARFVLFV